MIANAVTLPLSDYKAQHVRLTVDGKVATLTLNRPDKKNPLTFESYAEIANIFRAAVKDKQVKAFVLTGEGGNFCSGGDVFEIIGPLVEMNTVDLLEFTRMTGEAVKAMRQCPQPIVAAIDGVCAGAGAILAMASDMRLGTAKAKVAFLFNRVGLAAAIWVRAPSCRGLSDRGAHPSCFTQADRWAARKLSAGAFSIAFARPRPYSPMRPKWRRNWPMARPSPTA